MPRKAPSPTQTPAKPSRKAAKPPASRKDTLICLLRRPQGATVPEMMEVSGWQAHSVRGFISGTLKTKLGLTIETTVEDSRGRVYRIVGAR